MKAGPEPSGGVAGRPRAGGGSGGIDGGTRLLALLGNPVAHSLSPLLQNAAFRAAEVNGVYLALRTGPEELSGLLRGIARAGGGGNVTLPHKEAALKAVEAPTAEAERTGAVNTFWLEDGVVRGDNTDVEGVRVALGDLLPDREPKRVLLLGAGGASRAVLAALGGGGGRAPLAGDEGGRDAPVRVCLWNRTRERARALADRFRSARLEIEVLSTLPGPELPVEIVVNATRLGLGAGDPHPLPVDRLPEGAAVLDLVYGPGETAWVHAARQAGHRASDGGGMLVAQGGAAFRRWWGMEPPMEAYREALARIRQEPR